MTTPTGATVDFGPAGKALEQIRSSAAVPGDTTSHLIPLLQELQEAYGYLPVPVLQWVSRETGLPMKVAYEDRSENVTTVVFSKIEVPKKFAKGTFYPPRPRGLGWEYHVKRFDAKPDRK